MEGQGAVRKTSIIILSYNTYELTRLCIESIRRYTSPGSYEIIVIDNGSKDGSVAWLRQQSGIQIILNEKNVGFPAGCNQGIKATSGTDILLLNSDTIVTPHWLEQLGIALYSSTKVGAVGCVTNHCSNGQQIDVSYESIQELQSFAKKYNHSNPAKWISRTTLVGFCFLFKREIYEKVGLLDEIFSPGNYEDDDYSLRILQAGYELLLCEDTFIHHFGSASFTQSLSEEEKQVKARAYQEILERNQQKFLSKWQMSLNYKLLPPLEILSLLQADNKKICFITCVNDEAKYQRCVASLRQLKLPDGMKAEYLPIYGAASMTAGYEAARQQSRAKYKIYLHQDVEVIYPRMLELMLEVFQQNPDYGLLGVVGSQTIPANGIWWDSPVLLGAVYDDHTREMRAYAYLNKRKTCSEAMALDGLLLATQYDVPWRVDLFTKWDFYDLSQCMEFRRRKYRVGTLPQRMPWCVHHCGVNKLENYNHERIVFLNEYARCINNSID